MPAKATPGRSSASAAARLGAHRSSAGEVVDDVVGGRVGRLRLGARAGAAEDEDGRQAGAPAALDVGGDPVADHRHPRRRPGAARGPARRGGAPACRRSRPLRPKRSRPRRGSRRSPARRRPASAGSGRGWSRTAPPRAAGPASRSAAPRSRSSRWPETSTASALSRRLALEQLEPGGRDRLLEAPARRSRRRSRPSPPAPRPGAAVDHPGGDDPLLVDRRPRRRAGARRRPRPACPGCW